MLPVWRIAQYRASGYNCTCIFIAPEQTRRPPALSTSLSSGDAWIEHLAQQAEREVASRAPSPGCTRWDAATRFSELACEIVPGLRNRIRIHYDSPVLCERIYRLAGQLQWQITAIPEQAAAHVYRVLSEQGDTSRCRATVPHDLWDHARVIYFRSETALRHYHLPPFHSDTCCRSTCRADDVQALIASAPALADTASYILCERLKRDGISKIDAQGWVGENFDPG